MEKNAPGSPMRYKGLLGYRHTGKDVSAKPPDTKYLLDHKDSGWEKDDPDANHRPPSSGPRLVHGRSHVSVTPWALHKHAATEVHEYKFRPSVVPMAGPPVFVPPPPPARLGRPADSPNRGRAHIDRGHHDIFGVGTAPVAPRRTDSPRGRSRGLYSPLRAHPGT